MRSIRTRLRLKLTTTALLLSFSGSAGADSERGLEQPKTLQKLMQVASVNRAVQPHVRDIILELAHNSPWWKEREKIPGWWAKIHDFRNITTTVLSISVGQPTPGLPVSSKSEVYRVINCTSVDRSEHVKYTVTVQNTVSATVTNSFTSENNLDFNIGTNQQIATFLGTNLQLGKKITVNLTSQDSKTETSNEELTYEEDRPVPKMTRLALNVKKVTSASSLPFATRVLIDGEVYIEWFRPGAASGSQHVIGWRSITKLFRPAEEARTREVNGIVTNGRSDVTDKTFIEKKLKTKDCEEKPSFLLLPDDVE